MDGQTLLDSFAERLRSAHNFSAEGRIIHNEIVLESGFPHTRNYVFSVNYTRGANLVLNLEQLGQSFGKRNVVVTGTGLSVSLVANPPRMSHSPLDLSNHYHQTILNESCLDLFQLICNTLLEVDSKFCFFDNLKGVSLESPNVVIGYSNTIFSKRVEIVFDKGLTRLVSIDTDSKIPIDEMSKQAHKTFADNPNNQQAGLRQEALGLLNKASTQVFSIETHYEFQNIVLS